MKKYPELKIFARIFVFFLLKRKELRESRTMTDVLEQALLQLKDNKANGIGQLQLPNQEHLPDHLFPNLIINYMIRSM